MQTRVILLSLLAFSACCQATTPIWDNWVLPTWTATWQYNTSWVPPTPLPGYGRNVIGQSSDPADNYFYLRSNHYLWTNTSDAKYKYICGPETYLNGSALCVKNPKYWNSSSSVSEYCIPEKITKGVRITCETVYSASVSACCYRSSSDDLRNIYRQASIYPPGHDQSSRCLFLIPLFITCFPFLLHLIYY